MAVPTYHPNLITSILSQFITYAEESNAPYKAVTLPYSFLVSGFSKPAVPDIAVICHPAPITTLQIPDRIPVFAIEITTPETRYRDYVENYRLYREMGVKEYWILDWPHRTLSACMFFDAKNMIEKYSLPGTIAVKTFRGLKIHLDCI